MEKPTEIAREGLAALLGAGAEKAQCRFTQTTTDELNVDLGECSLLRTTFDTHIDLAAIKDRRKGSTSLNRSGGPALQEAAAAVIGLAAASAPDEAHEIAPAQPAAVFTAGASRPDRDKLYSRLKELLHEIGARYPRIMVRQAILDFTRTESALVNSNGVDFVTRKGIYRASVFFSSREGERVSSFNITGFSSRDLERSLLECGSLDTLLRQSTEQLVTRPLQGKFVGEVIITPDCLGDLLAFLSGAIGDGPLISGTSIYRDRLGKRIAAPVFSLHSRPAGGEICDGYFVTADGYAAGDLTIVENGVLKSFLLSLYGSRKTGLPRAVNDGSAFVVDPGETAFEEMVRSVKRGLLLARFSGGVPGESGDFAGVAKNSYLIEDGEIKYPLSETMIAGNFAEIFKSITAVSRERIDFGSALLPWVAASGVTVSGK
ncbi:MAG: TldD/PmbA family protein [Firmicutes bacterium]|nr:TldD/PmbA family protein [Bacillota bacterium]